jgi:hypothetical protein
MVSAQIQRLMKDSEDCQLFIDELLRNGDTDRAQKVVAKKQFLDNHIAEIQNA